MALSTWLWDPGADDPTDSLPDCQCGRNSWEQRRYSDEYTCRHCGTGPGVTTLHSATVRVARKAHGKDIAKGDTYKHVVEGGYFPGGKRWLAHRDVLVSKAVPPDPVWPD